MTGPGTHGRRRTRRLAFALKRRTGTAGAGVGIEMLGRQVGQSMGYRYGYHPSAGHDRDTHVSTHTRTRPACYLHTGTNDPQRGTGRESSEQGEQPGE